MSYPLHPRLEIIFALTDGLEASARELFKTAHREYVRDRRRRGATLRPGPSAPLWSALAEACRPYLRKRGEKAYLSRILGVHPSRVHQFFVSNRAMPDAERTLALLLWLAQRRSGVRAG